MWRANEKRGGGSSLSCKPLYLYLFMCVYEWRTQKLPHQMKSQSVSWDNSFYTLDYVCASKWGWGRERDRKIKIDRDRERGCGGDFKITFLYVNTHASYHHSSDSPTMRVLKTCIDLRQTISGNCGPTIVETDWGISSLCVRGCVK